MLHNRIGRNWWIVSRLLALGISDIRQSFQFDRIEVEENAWMISVEMIPFIDSHIFWKKARCSPLRPGALNDLRQKSADLTSWELGIPSK